MNRVLQAFVVTCFIALLASAAGADRAVNASEIIVLSDDIYKHSTEVVHAGDGADGGGDDPGDAPASNGGEPGNNRSGLGDYTNPGQGGGRSNSSNTGENNPNRAR